MVSAILKKANKTTGPGMCACMEQQVLLNKDRCPRKCELGELCHLSQPHLQSPAILSTPPPPRAFASLKVYIPPRWQLCVTLNKRQNARPHVVHNFCVWQPPHAIWRSLNRVAASALRAGAWAYEAVLDGCSALSCSYSPSPSSCFFLALIFCNKIFCLCWMSETQLSHICQKNIGGGGSTEW